MSKATQADQSIQERVIRPRIRGRPGPLHPSKNTNRLIHRNTPRFQVTIQDPIVIINRRLHETQNIQSFPQHPGYSKSFHSKPKLFVREVKA
ncbi:hypothetical protein QJS10_CPA08g01517 [Acorus calamus]|uniref:Uncharacterized protein n=1 Tax=Acorus calamus TaxID=4465 RepID=A0AAV9EBD3_ACOCL|nr:hypothetical protein QJS10_CPA08g01517 [Acorus calamus]